MLSELLTSVSAKVAAASFAAVTTVGTGAAAATGHLPGDLQDQAAAVAENFGVDLPDSSEDVREDSENRQDSDAATQNRQDDENRQDENGEGTDTDDAVLDTLSDDSTPGDEDFGTDVSENAKDGDLGDEVSGTATESNEGANNSDGAATTGDDDANNSDGASDNEYRENAPSESGEQDDPEYDGDDNPGDTHRE